MYSRSLCLPHRHRLLPQIVISHISQSGFNNPSRRGMNLFYPAVCVSCRWRESGSNSKEQRVRVSGPLRPLSAEKLASVWLRNIRATWRVWKRPLIFYSRGKQTLTFNAAVLDIWIYCVWSVPKNAMEVCRHEMPCNMQRNTALNWLILLIWSIFIYFIPYYCVFWFWFWIYLVLICCCLFLSYFNIFLLVFMMI